MPEYQTMRVENERIFYLLLTPFRWLIGTLKLASLILIGILIMTYNHLGWIVGLGHMGYLSRKATADIMVGIPRPLSFATAPEKSGEFTIDLSARKEMDRPDSLSDQKVARVAIDPLPESYLGAIHPPEYCDDLVQKDDPGQKMVGWLNRTRTVYDRKSSRMFEAYVTGAISVSYLRTALTRIKLHIDPVYEGDPWPNFHTDCEMDPDDAVASYPEEFAGWKSVSRGIKIPAPRINMRVVSGVLYDGPSYNGPKSYNEIVGMCLETECGTTGLRPYVTWYADLFDEHVPLSPEQEHAVAVLNGLASFDYWLHVARQNGIAGHEKELRPSGFELRRGHTHNEPGVQSFPNPTARTWRSFSDELDKYCLCSVLTFSHPSPNLRHYPNRVAC